jgi:flagellin
MDGSLQYFDHAPDGSATYSGVQGVGASGEATVDGTLMLQVVNNNGAPAVQETFIQSASGYVTVSSTLFSANSTITANMSGSSAAGFDNVAITIGNITSADVGQTAYIKVSQHVDATSFVTAQPLTIQSGANEGDTVEIGIQATNAQTLRISNINVALSSSTNPTLGAEDAIGQADIALNMLLQQRAQLGAVIVRLNEDANNNNVAAVNMQASESAIRDLNVGQATTEFTRLQVMVQVGTSVLAQSNANADSVLGLFR